MAAQEDAFAKARRRMVEEQIAARGVRDARVLEAMRSVPRHLFVPPKYAEWAYGDGPLPIGNGQTISQPYIVALMTELLEIPPQGARVLEIGTGSGYQTAILAHLAAEVFTIERHASLAAEAKARLRRLGLENVHFRVGDGTLGWPEHAPYDGILVTAAAPEMPPALSEQVRLGGHIVIPLGGRGGQTLERWTRREDDFERESIIPVAFVPLVGKQGWPET